MNLKGFYNRDCMEAMKEIPDNYFELAIVDPPYGINVNVSIGRKKGDKKRDYHKFHGKDTDAPSKEYFLELDRISKNQIIWGANYFIDRLPSPNNKSLIVWDKPFSNSSAELAWCSLNETIKIYKQLPTSPSRILPTQKPVALYKWLLNNYAKKGDKILDTHVGSASSLIACYDLGFEYLGFELDEDYYNEALDRLTKHKSQMNMFLDF